eukprot:TRINITY_DN11502_c0_g1_i1.p1 TRINITY_DN11502_c0_g1~~TRINITY_DN11502_c0_g1_i1.p1  ORF type:complete len:463 (+),score=77.86 TRINITY_DN11502_c0_g1_i1:293-1681(+)
MATAVVKPPVAPSGDRTAPAAPAREQSSGTLMSDRSSRPTTRGSQGASGAIKPSTSQSGIVRAQSVMSNVSALSVMPTDALQSVVHTIPPLTELCVQVLADNFYNNPSFLGLPPKFAAKVAALLPIDMPLEIAARPIVDEDYWNRRSVERWRNCQVSEHGGSWKRLFFEKHFQEALETFDDSEPAMEELSRLMNLMWESVFTIHVRQLPSHLDLGIVFNGCPYLTELRLTYGIKSIGMDYRRDLFGMRPNDAACLARALQTSKYLERLYLADNRLNDDTTRQLAVGLCSNYTLRLLDLSHNRIDDRGARALAKALGQEQCMIETLLLTDNRVHETGAQALGKALKKNKVLKSLDLRLNRIGDAGGAAVMAGLAQNSTLQSLNLGSNSLEMDTTRALTEVLKQNETLERLDLSCNDIPAEGGELLLDALAHNSTLLAIDLRMNKVDQDKEREIQASRSQPILS